MPWLVQSLRSAWDALWWRELCTRSSLAGIAEARHGLRAVRSAADAAVLLEVLLPLMVYAGVPVAVLSPSAPVRPASRSPWPIITL